MRAELSLGYNRYFFGLRQLNRRLQLKIVCNDLRPRIWNYAQWVKAARLFFSAVFLKNAGAMPQNFYGFIPLWLDLFQLCMWATDEPFNELVAPA